MSDERLWGDEWMELRRADGFYTYAHHVKGPSGVLVLAYNQDGRVVVRKEYVPCHPPSTIPGDPGQYTSLTGMVEEGRYHRDVAQAELHEEAGLDVRQEKLRYLGGVYPSKFMDYKQYLYAVDFTGLRFGLIEGDGSRGEQGASIVLMSLREAIAEVQDPGFMAAVLLACQRDPALLRFL